MDRGTGLRRGRINSLTEKGGKKKLRRRLEGHRAMDDIAVDVAEKTCSLTLSEGVGLFPGERRTVWARNTSVYVAMPDFFSNVQDKIPWRDAGMPSTFFFFFLLPFLKFKFSY